MSQRRVDQWLTTIGGFSAHDVELGLERVARVYARLRRGPVARCIVTIAGTNGKGTCAHFLERALRAGGRRTGLYTSPHLLRFNERLQVAGEPICDAELCASFERVERAREGEALTYFEFTTLAALAWFEACDLDVAVLEVGLGGRLDAVNVVDPDLAVVTGIALDHTDWLGESLDEIAREKAGIFRARRPAISADPAPPAALREVAEAVGAQVYFRGREFKCHANDSRFSIAGSRLTLDELPRPPGMPLAGVCAALTALAFLDALPERAWLEEMLGNWQLPGRLQWVPGQPSVLLDVAHNPQAAAVLAARVATLAGHGQLHVVIGMLQDKDAEGFVRQLGDGVSQCYAVTLDGPRGQTAAQLARRLRRDASARVNECASVAGAMALARSRAGDEDTLLVCGSFQVVGPALAWLGIYSRSHATAAIEGT